MKKQRDRKVSRRHISIAKKPARGKPFEKGNDYAWKPGRTGNPAGRPKVRTLTEAYRSLLAQDCPYDPQGRSYADVIAAHLIMVAADLVAGNSTQPAHELGDRTEGKARHAVPLDPVADAMQILASLLGISVDQLPPLNPG